MTIEMQGGSGKSESLTVEKLLVATGRGPVTDGLGAAEAGLTLDRGYVKVDPLFRTSVPGISAIGDVITIGAGAHPQLAHLSSAEGIVLAERLAGQDVAADQLRPGAGLHLLRSRDRQRRPDRSRKPSSAASTCASARFPFGVLGRAKMMGETEGFVKIVAEKKYDELLGVHMIGPRATELVAEAAVALRLESTVEELIRTIHAHPTMSEAVGEAAHAVHGAAIHL